MRVISIVVCVMLISSCALAETIPTNDAVRAIIGEAGNQGYLGMLAVACGIRNRGTLKGVCLLYTSDAADE